LHSPMSYATDRSAPQASGRAGMFCRQDEWVLRVTATWSSFAGDTSRARRYADFGTVPWSWFVFLACYTCHACRQGRPMPGLCLHKIAWVPHTSYTHVRL
ncbi:hypothetical protein COCC4DRAFT_132982, partial [Bipolaris maydis ATCC 48331]